MRIGLGARIFLATTLIVVAVLGGALLLTGRQAGRAADQSLVAALEAAGSSVRDALQAREDRLRQVTATIARVPANVSYVETAVRQGDRSSLVGQAQEFADQIGADWVLITDAEGILQASTLDPNAEGEPLGEGALIGIPLSEGRSADGLWIEVGPDGADMPYQAVAVPLLAPGGTALYGVLVAAIAIDEGVAQVLKENTAAEILFFTLDTLGVARPVVSTRPEQAVDSVLASFGADSLFTAMGYTWLSAPVAADRLVGAVSPLLSAADQPLGGFVAMRSRAAEMATFSLLRQTLFIAFGAGVVLALVASFILARTVTRPVRALVDVTRRVREGQFSGDIPTGGRDEVGELATAFQAMVQELRDKQALVDYLSQAGGATVQLTTPDQGTMSSRLDVGGVFAGRYEITKVLGRGGMGVVYRARDRELDEVVAIKTLLPEALDPTGTSLERFKQEVRLARRISHRNVVRLHDFGEVDGTYYITMEYVEGTNLKDLIRRRGRLPVGAALAIGKQLCRALEVAHDEGVIHRDIKPQNIAVDPGGVVKVMDFGIARLAKAPAVGEGLTAMGMTVGTPEYMAPEQLMGDEVDARADLYAAGVVLFECVTGRMVFEATSLPALVAKHLEEAPTDPRSLNPEVPEALAQIILRALAKDRAARWPSATELALALDALGRDS
jgi:serine/threonine-protein kinase